MPGVTGEYISHAAGEEGVQGGWKPRSRLNTRISIFLPPSVEAINVIAAGRPSGGRGVGI